MNIALTPEEILKQMALIEQMEKGSLSTIRHTPKGPCCNFQRWEGNRNVSEYIAAEQVPTVREHLEGYAQFEALSAQYVQLVSERTRQGRLAGVQKKRRMPKSSSPRKPKSGN